MNSSRVRCVALLAAFLSICAHANVTAKDAPPKVLLGFAGEPYAVVNSADVTAQDASGPCPATFSGGLLSSSNAAGLSCANAATGANNDGLYVVVALEQPTPFTSNLDVDGIDFHTWKSDIVHVTVCRAQSDCAAHQMLTVYVDRNNHAYAEQFGHILTGTIDAADYRPEKTHCKPPADAPLPAKIWCEKISIPWTVLELAPRNDFTITVSALLAGTETSLASGAVEIDAASAFGLKAADLPPSFDNRRMAVVSGYDQYSAQVSTPPTTTAIRFVPGGLQTFTLSTPFTPAAAPDRFPPPTIEVSSPLSQSLLVNGVVSQNNSFVKNVQSSIKDAVGLFPKDSAPTFPCASCTTFQSQNHALFDIPALSNILGDAASSGGSNENPMKVSDLPDLYGGAALYVASTDGGWTLAALQANPVKGSGAKSRTDSAFSLMRKSGSAVMQLETTLVNHPQSANGTAGGFPAVALPQMNQYSVSLSDQNVKSNGISRTTSDVAPTLRFSYDATDRALSTFAGVQLTQAKYWPSGMSGSESLVAGFRGMGTRYNVLDGTASAYRAVSGPFASLDLAWSQSADALTPKIELSGYYFDYRARIDRYSLQNAKISVGLGKAVAAFYQFQTGRVSSVLAAITQIGSDLGDTPYQTAAQTIIPQIRTNVYALRDQATGLTWKFTTLEGASSTISAEYDFDHIAPKCSIPPGSVVVECTPPGPATGTFAGTVGVAAGPITVAAKYEPSFLNGTHGAVETEHVYDAALAYQYDKCTSLIFSASNDAQVLSPTLDGNIQTTVSEEFDSQFRAGGFAPTLVVGSSNDFSSDQAKYTGFDPLIGAQTTVGLPFKTHTVSFYVGLRLGNREYRNTTSPKCGI